CFNEVFFDGARVPKDCLVGEKNLGWYTLATALNYERSGVSMPSGNLRMLKRLTQYAKETPWEDGVLFDNPRIRHKLAEMTMETEICRLICYRAIWLQSTGKVPAAEASMSFLVGSELSRKLANTGIEMLGSYGQLEKGSKWALFDGSLANMYLSTLPLGIGGGTNEVQRNLIALLGLGLPKG
ncbi:MAG: acyl-CoA dehydrogenase, partial [Proteobacteria bacterium]|nr:acyl-CoA dehydrogenase [Pseudomonadota bacterium]